MRTSHRDRCRPAFAALSVAVVIVLAVIPCTALHAEYRVFQNGTAYNASVEVTGAEKYEFVELGLLGERIPQKVGNIRLEGDCSPCTFNTSGASAITFSRGNYTVQFMAPLRDYHFLAAFDAPYSINVTLPEEFDVRNPLLAGISPGAEILGGANNTTTVHWNRTRSVDLRFYDRNRETLLYLFGNFWVVIAVVLLIPFLLTIRKTA